MTQQGAHPLDADASLYQPGTTGPAQVVWVQALNPRAAASRVEPGIDAHETSAFLRAKHPVGLRTPGGPPVRPADQGGAGLRIDRHRPCCPIFLVAYLEADQMPGEIHATPFEAQGPVGFSSTVIPEHWRLWYAINPMVGVIDGFRWAILGGEVSLYWPGFLLSWGVIAGCLWLGIRQFRRMEKSFADLI